MENPYNTTSVFVTHTYSASWQEQLRRSVRLYLALGGPAVNEQELLTHLQRTEQELLDYLLQGAIPTPEERERAQAILDMAQSALLRSEDEVELLLKELAAEQAQCKIPADFTAPSA
ncbi:hypothetical protein [Hymenobacter sp. BRD67]|uniref:hypothetical protein n=1 Tax=Hymenobacter sp. BRD67 TaxID=2675877 RepID=UPI0015641CAC|nr:hypothetical protein [Hymenobacter sp. BRD67]QKG52714.1 hypothetical protein GKZ67_09005 [Hymenobacter sp. BRD67]